MVYSQVSIEEGLRVKKLLYISDVDEFNGCSQPLNDLVLSTVLNVIPSKTTSKCLKTGYIVDLSREGGFSPCSVILALLYIKRLSLSNPGFFTTLSSRELFLVSMLVASKFLNDEGEMEALTNTDFATIGSIPRNRLDHLEIRFLQAIDWRLFVPLDEYYQFVRSVEGRVALNEAVQRGWFSYTDLCAVWEASDSMVATSKTTAKVACGSALLYLMCIATLFASTPTQHGNDLSPLTSPASDFCNEVVSSSNLAIFDPLMMPALVKNYSSIPPDLSSLEPLVNISSNLDRKKSRPKNSLTKYDDFGRPISDKYRNILTEEISRKKEIVNLTSNEPGAPSNVPSNGHLDPGLFLLFNLTAAITMPELLTPDNSIAMSSPGHQFNPLVSLLIHPNEQQAWNGHFNPHIDTATEDVVLNTLLVNAKINGHDGWNLSVSHDYFNPSMPQYPRAEQPDHEVETNHIRHIEQKKHFHHNSDFSGQLLSPRWKDYQSPVVVIETIPMVTESGLWDYNIPRRVEKNNFTLKDVLGMLAHSVLAW